MNKKKQLERFCDLTNKKKIVLKPKPLVLKLK